MFALDDVESTDARADVHADAFVIFRSDLQAGSFERLIGGGDGKVNEPCHFLDLFFLNVVQRVEAFDLGGDLASERAHIELRDALHS